MAFLDPSPYSVLGKPVYDMEAAIEYMKGVTVVVVSQVAFYRDLCPKSEFKEVDILNMKVQFLKRSSNHFVVKYLMKHINGAFEMLDQKHLKSFSLVVKDQTRTYRLEAYTLSYKYDSDSPQLTYSTNSSLSGVDCPIDYVHNSTLDLLLRLEETLTYIVQKPLPEVCVIDFELRFCDDAPPDCLVPTGYRFQTDEEIEHKNVFLETPMKFRSGRIKSDFASMTFHSKFARGLIRDDSMQLDEDA